MDGKEIVLKPCPFCGSNEISEGESMLKKDGRYHKQNGCTNCGAFGPITVVNDIRNNTRANKAWNWRKGR